jgi:hypothetical protein
MGTLGATGQLAFSFELGDKAGIRFLNCCDSLFAAYARVLFQELVQCFAAFHILNQYLEWNASTAKNRLSAQNIRVSYDGALHRVCLSFR